MKIDWLQVLIDLPSDHFTTSGDFWALISATTKGDVNPDYPHFVRLVPADGDMTLELQRLDEGPPSVHLDLVVDDIPAATEHAVACGATLVDMPFHAVLETPGGVPFCIVPAGDVTGRRPPVIDADLPHAVDQICIDVPHDSFAADVAFWSGFTGWEVNDPMLPEFRSFAQPDALPIRLLIQRLGEADVGPARAHLDISAGEHVDAVVARHVEAGASVSGVFEHWTALTDPAGLAYCVTGRRPAHP